MSKSRHANAVVALALLIIAVTSMAGPAHAQTDPDTGAALQSARDTLTKWVDTQRHISREREDWVVGKDVLEQRIALLEGEVASLEGKIDETLRAIEDADVKQRALAAEADALDAALTGLGSAADRLEVKTATMLETLPNPIRERIEPLARRLPDADVKSAMTLGQRFQNVIGILNEINKFNAVITVTNELRDLPDGQTAEVRTLYVGLGQAWYVSPGGDAAGVGRPTPDGWQWDAANELAPQIIRAIKIFDNEEAPAYVPLPVTIR